MPTSRSRTRRSGRQHIAALIKAHPAAAFLGIAFTWTFGWDTVLFLLQLWDRQLFTIPRIWGPMIAGFVVAWSILLPRFERGSSTLFACGFHPGST